MFAVCGVQFVVVELQREERVNQGTERHPIAPAGREVLDVYVLKGEITRFSVHVPSHLMNRDTDVSVKGSYLWMFIGWRINRSFSSYNITDLRCKVSYSQFSYLISDGFGAAPLQEKLFDPTGTGDPEALRALQFGLWVLRPVPETNSSSLVSMGGSRLNGETVQSHSLGWFWVHPFKERSFGLSPVGAGECLRLHQVLFELNSSGFVRFPVEKQQVAHVASNRLKHGISQTKVKKKSKQDSW